MFQDRDDVFYSNIKLWDYFDRFVSNNRLIIELFNSYSDDGKSSNQKIKITICTKNNLNVIVLEPHSLFRYVRMLESFIISKLNKLKENILSDQKFTDGFSMELKKNIYTTYMWCPSSNSPCVRIMLGYKEQSILDSEKVYIEIPEFLSYYKILDQIFNNYVSSSVNNHLIFQINDLKKNQIKIMNRLHNMQIEQQKTEIVVQETKTDILSEEPINVDIGSGEEDVDEDNEQNEFDKFLLTNRDTYELDLGDEQNLAQKKTEREIFYESKFVKNTLKNNFDNLEKVILNCVNSNLPFDSFINTIKMTCDIDIYSGLSQQDINALNYLITRNIKHNVNLYIQKKVKLPSATIPIIVNNNIKDDDTIDIMYQILLTYIYISKVKVSINEKVNNDADNKDLFSYSLKTITSPLVFSYFLNIEKDMLKTTINRIYHSNRDVGFYKEYESKLKNYGVSGISLSSDYINDQIDRIYDTALKIKDKLTIDNYFNTNKLVVLKYNDFKDTNKLKFNDIYILCELDWAYLSNGNKIDNSKLTIPGYDSIPLNILSRYGLSTKKYDNTVLIRYIQENFPNFEDLEQIKKINKNVYDVLDDLNIINYPENCLKALYYWDINKIPKNTTYNQFCTMIDNSKLTKNMLVSMILDKRNEIDNMFYSSFVIAKY